MIYKNDLCSNLLDKLNDKQIIKKISENNEISNFVCQQCDKKFNDKYNLNKHIRNNHSKIIITNEIVDIDKILFFYKILLTIYNN